MHGVVVSEATDEAPLVATCRTRQVVALCDLAESLRTGWASNLDGGGHLFGLQAPCAVVSEDARSTITVVGHVSRDVGAFTFLLKDHSSIKWV